MSTNVDSGRVRLVEPPDAPNNARSRAYYWTKRIIDIAVASVALLVISPLVLGLALLVKLDSPGRAFFSHDRVGSRRRNDGTWELHTFRMHKIRTMRRVPDDKRHLDHIRRFVAGELESNPAGYKIPRDDRVTYIGVFLRRTSIDELPQLVNVLKGEMSLVGPRPVPPYEVAQYSPAAYARLNATPGMTGLWQIGGRSQLTFDEMVRLDIEYIERASTTFDLQILIRTIPAVLRRRGAG